VEGVQDIEVQLGYDPQQPRRRYLLYTPKPRPDESSLPLILVGPGSNMSPEQMLEVSVLLKLADMQRFALAVFAGAGRDMNLNVVRHAAADMNGPDDIAYARAVLDDVATRTCIDHRIFCTGYSRGARFCSRLASEMSGLIQAIAPVGGVRYPEPNNATRPVPVFAIHGTKDPVNPYNGHGFNYWYEAVPMAIDKWAKFNGCMRQEEKRVSEHTVMRRHTQCSDNADVVLITVEDGGHTWPGTTYSFKGEELGPTNLEISSSVMVWSFFMEHATESQFSSEVVPGSLTYAGVPQMQRKAVELPGIFAEKSSFYGRGAMSFVACTLLLVFAWRRLRAPGSNAAPTETQVAASESLSSEVDIAKRLLPVD